MEYCPHCMKPAEGPVCASCGGQVNWKAGAGQLSVGSLLRGSNNHTYQIGAARGQGGFGITYAAMDLDSGERVAVKEYFPTRCAQRTQLNQVTPMTGQTETYQGGMKSFLEEAMMLSAVGAVPSVVTVIDYFEANGTAYLVMEFVDGVPLHQVVSKRGKIPADELMPKFQGLLRDLDILHRAGVIHRDISPDNLIWQPNGTLKLLDFGSARSVQDGKSMTVLLKAGFSPVEQYQTRGQGPWTDVYALAGTIYYCLTGVIPPSAVDRLDRDDLQPPTALGAELSTEQEEALLWGLTVQPKSRPVSMDIFSQRLYPSKPVQISKPEFVQKAAEKAAELGKTIKSTIETPKPETASNAEPAPTSKQKPKSSGSKFKGFWANQFRFNPKAAGKKFLRLGIVLAALLLLAGIISGIIYLATHGTTKDGFIYELHDSYAKITGYTGDEANVVIPDTIRKKAVEYLDSGAFEGCKIITSVTLPDDIYLFSAVFRECTQLRLVTVEGDVSLYSSDFAGCTNLRCILFLEQDTYQSHLEHNRFEKMPSVVLCYVGQDTGIGQLKTTVVDELGVVYAITNQSKAVVLSLPDGLSPDILAGRTIDGCPIVLSDGTTPGAAGPEPDPEPLYGTTEDGYKYMITADRTECWITGYTGSEEYLYTPDKVDGIPITGIAEGAFAGNSTMESIWMPFYLETVEADAFKSCSNLRDIYVYSDVSAAAGAFAGCSRLRCLVRTENVSVGGLGLPASCEVYPHGMETGAGALDYVEVDNSGNIYAVTEEDRAVLMSVSVSADCVVIPDTVVWVYEKALDRVDSDVIIEMPEELLFPMELAHEAEWRSKDNTFSLSYNWAMTCMSCMNIMDLRSLPMDTSRELVEAAMIRAKELAQSYGSERPDGSNFSTILDECDVDWSYVSTYRSRFDTSAEDYGAPLVNDRLDEILAVYAAPEEENENQYYTSFAAALYYDNDTGILYLGCFAIME